MEITHQMVHLVRKKAPFASHADCRRALEFTHDITDAANCLKFSQRILHERDTYAYRADRNRSHVTGLLALLAVSGIFNATFIAYLILF